MWFKDDHLVVRRRNKQNRRKRKSRESLLTVDARVTEKRKEKVQRLSAIVLSLVALAGVGWLAIAGLRFVTQQLFTQNDQYVIRQLDLLSDGKLKARHIREYGKLEEGLNLFGLNLKEVRSSLLSVPEVQSVEISRLLPDKLVVRITERLALARLGADDRKHHLAIDRNGHVLGPSSRRKSLPALTGLRDRGLRPGDTLTEGMIQDALNLLDVCDTTRLGQVVKIQAVDVRNPEFMDLQLATGETVRMGRDRLEWRLRWLARILQESQHQGKQHKFLDLTVDKNAAGVSI